MLFPDLPYLPMLRPVAARLLVAACFAFGVCEREAHAQSPQAVRGTAGGVSVGQDLDDYLRYLQTMGKVPLMPWGLRGFSPKIVDSLTAISGEHPWKSSWLFRQTSGQYIRILPIDVTARFNSSYPWGMNEGPVWSGRGLTTSAAAGVSGAWGPLTIVINPIVFRAENMAFQLEPTGLSGNGQFADAIFPTSIDRPQRFGNGAYTHFDLGETTIRLDGFGLSVGGTTANEWWGPASVFPYIVGDNAAGVPRIFFGTARPTNIGLGRLQARVEYGVEFQSKFSPVVGPDTYLDVDSTGRRRTMSALVMTFSPAGVPGLELGAGRYFHRPWTGRITASDLKSPLEGLVTASPTITASSLPTGAEAANQLASIWVRWVFPRSGLEVYGEYGHEDHNIDTRDLYSELDHSRTALLGFRKAFQQDSLRFSGLRAEWFDGTPSTNARHREEGLIYPHYPLRQGHTEEGKVIGSAAGVGSPAAAILAWDEYTTSGRNTLYLVRRAENSPLDGSFAINLQSEIALGNQYMRFMPFGDVQCDLAGIRRTHPPVGTGGWSLNVTAGLRIYRLSVSKRVNAH